MWSATLPLNNAVPVHAVERRLRDEFPSVSVQASATFDAVQELVGRRRQPEGNGCIERFFRTLKEQLLWVRHFRDVEALRQALLIFKDTYNRGWLLERLGYRSPMQARADFALGAVA